MENTNHIRDSILDRLIPHVPFDGWSKDALSRASAEAGYAPDMGEAVFPFAMDDVVAHFADRADREMLAALEGQDISRMRDKITQAVRQRLIWLDRHKEAERAAVAYWMRPIRKYRGMKIVWRTADCIWNWAGDTATDYNRYTKRILLAGVLTSTVLYWMKDNNLEDTFAFLDRRIENVLTFGTLIGGMKKRRA
jgi:ubiquinone biosynthesis protein COQ9